MYDTQQSTRYRRRTHRGNWYCCKGQGVATTTTPSRHEYMPIPADARPADRGRRMRRICSALGMRSIGDKRSATNSHDAPRETRIGVFLAVAKSLPGIWMIIATPAPTCPLRPLRVSSSPSGGNRVVRIGQHGANVLTGKRLNGPRHGDLRVGRVERVAVP